MKIRRTVAIATAAAALTAVVAGPSAVEAASNVLWAQNSVNALKLQGHAPSVAASAGKVALFNAQGKIAAGAMNFRAAAGRTYTGSFGVTGTAPAGTDPASAPYVVGTAITLPGNRGVANFDIGVNGGNENPDCGGSFAQPTAAPGALCLYPGRTGGSTPEVQNVAVNGEGAFNVNAVTIGGGTHGIRVDVPAAAAGQVAFYGTWAYTPAN